MQSNYISCLVNCNMNSYTPYFPNIPSLTTTASYCLAFLITATVLQYIFFKQNEKSSDIWWLIVKNISRLIIFIFVLVLIPTANMIDTFEEQFFIYGLLFLIFFGMVAVLIFVHRKQKIKFVLYHILSEPFKILWVVILTAAPLLVLGAAGKILNISGLYEGNLYSLFMFELYIALPLLITICQRFFSFGVRVVSIKMILMTYFLSMIFLNGPFLIDIITK